MITHTLELPVKWTKTGDPIPHRRGETLSLKIPASDGFGPASPLLGLIQSQRDPILLPGERERLDAEGVEEAVELANAQTEAKQAKEGTRKAEAARGRAEQARKREAQIDAGERVGRYAGEPYPPHMLDGVSRKHRAKARAANEEYSAERVRAAQRAGDQEDAQRKGREAEKLAWIEAHGSERLRAQIDLEYNGWPLYLHERLAADLPGAELHEDADDWDMVSNPTEEQLGAERVVGEELARLGFIEWPVPAETCWRWEPGESEDWMDDQPDRTPRLVVEGYRPGATGNGWKRYAVVFR